MFILFVHNERGGGLYVNKILLSFRIESSKLNCIILSKGPHDLLFHHEKLLKNQLNKINGQAILTSKSGVTLDSLLTKVTNKTNRTVTDAAAIVLHPSPRKVYELLTPVFGEKSQVFASDSSDLTSFAYDVENPSKVHLGLFSDVENSKNSKPF